MSSEVRPSRPPLLDIADLSVTIRAPTALVRALDGVSLTVGRGEVVGLVGESGGGKSMIARTIVRLLPRTATASGSVRLDGTDVLTLEGEALRLHRGGGAALCFQAPRSALEPTRTIGRQIADRLRAHRGLDRAAARAGAVRLLADVGIASPAERLDAYPHEFSGGMCQRVMIAMALACRAKLLIADEPTTGLDVTLTADILRLIAAPARNGESGVLVISHDIAALGDICDRILVIEAGRIVEAGPTKRVLTAPSHPYTRRLLAAIPDVTTPGFGGGEPSAPRPLVRIDRVGMTFPGRRGAGPRRALDNISLDIGRGETVGLVGESGSGKSTMARTVMGLLRPSEGRIEIDGHDLAALGGRALRAFRRHMQMVFQDPFDSLNPKRTVEQIIADPLRLLRLSARERDIRTDEILTEVGLDRSFRHRTRRELSGGQAQRVGIARAFVIDPQLVVLDEPTSALDATVQAQILDLIRRLTARRDRAYLFVSHDLAIVRGLCDRTVVLMGGRIVEAGPTEKLFTAPEHPYTRTLLEAAPRLPAAGAASAATGAPGQTAEGRRGGADTPLIPAAGDTADRPHLALGPKEHSRLARS